MNRSFAVAVSLSFSLLLAACQPELPNPVASATSLEKGGRQAASALTEQYAQQPIYFTNKFDNGQTPSVAINSQGHAIEVHKSEIDNTLWLRVGRTATNSVTWSHSVYVRDRDRVYLPADGPGPAYGTNPSVTLVGDQALMVYTNYSGQLYLAHLPTGVDEVKPLDLSATRIDMDGSRQGIRPVWGNHPSVAVSGARVFVAYERNGNLYYISGRVLSSGLSITWDGAPKHWGVGYNPSIALNRKGAFVGMYSRGDQLYVTTGAVNDKVVNNMGVELPFEAGTQPSVAIDEQGNVLSVYIHRNTMFRSVGQYINQPDGYSIYQKFFYTMFPVAASSAAIALADVGGQIRVLINVDSGQSTLHNFTGSLPQ